MLLFGLLFLGLLLGDGPQTVIDIYGVAIVLVLWVTRLFWKTSIARPPTALLLPWLAIFVAATASAYYSASISLSVSWIVRSACAYLLYRLFYDVASRQLAETYMHWALMFVIAAGALAGVSVFIPWVRSSLPSMNLVSLRYGHSHLADLLVFAAPAWFGYAVKRMRQQPVRVAALAVYFLTLLVTLARGAWLIVFGYVVYLCITGSTAIQNKVIKQTVVFFSAILFLLCVGSALYFATGRSDRGMVRIFRPQTILSRFEYWRQAIEAFRSRPLIGYGPGTFSLVSTRLQTARGISSWYAHSEPLQIAAEMGVLGLVAFVWLVVAHGAKLYSKMKQGPPISAAPRLILESVVMVALYGSYEFVLDYFVLWALVWSAAGLSIGLLWNQHEP